MIFFQKEKINNPKSSCCRIYSKRSSYLVFYLSLLKKEKFLKIMKLLIKSTLT